MNLRNPHDPYRWAPVPGPAGPPTGPTLPGWLAERLYDQRIVLLNGALTGPTATEAAAALLTLDALGGDPVRLHVASDDGELAAAFALIDALDAMAAPVHAVVTAGAGGAVLGVLAAADRRLAYRHARLRLAEPRSVRVSGTADEVAAAAGQHLRELEELVLRISAVTGRPRSRIEDDLAAGRTLDATQAREYGLIDAVVGEPDG